MYYYRRVLLFLAFYFVHFLHFIRRLLFGIEPRLSHSERVGRCYSFMHYVAVKTHSFSNYTEGYYEHLQGSYYDNYKEAQHNQLLTLLDYTKVGKNSLMLDSGCGNGDLSYVAKNSRGARTIGVTLSKEEVAILKKRGLDVVFGSYRYVDKLFEAEYFDAIIANGSSEHLISIDEAIVDYGESIFRRQMQQYWNVLKPGGYCTITCIHTPEKLDPKKVALPAWKFPLESKYWHYSVLVEFYSGWYPFEGQVIKIASDIGFEVVHNEDRTEDYLQTSLVWRKRIRERMSTVQGLLWCYYAIIREFIKDPIYAWYCLAHHWGCSWTWQFEPLLQEGKKSGSGSSGSGVGSGVGSGSGGGNGAGAKAPMVQKLLGFRKPLSSKKVKV